jgi:acyl carrier protein
MKMNRFELEVKEFVIDHLQKNMLKLNIVAHEIDDSFNFIESGVVDSMGFLELITRVEKRFKIEIDFEDYDPSEFTYLYGFVNCISRSKRSGCVK